MSSSEEEDDDERVDDCLVLVRLIVSVWALSYARIISVASPLGVAMFLLAILSHYSYR